MIDQDTIWAQQLADGPAKIGLRQDTYPVADPLVPAPFEGLPSKDLVIEGVGMQATRLLAMQQFWYNGLIGYSRPGMAQNVLTRIVVRDLTIDGNYAGLGGELPYADKPGPGLVSLAAPFTSAFAPPQEFSPYKHLFERVRFTRPCGFVVQPANSIHFRDCVFDMCGQPDLVPDATHWDIVGSGGWGDVTLENCVYINSSGNYVDLEGSTGQVRCDMLNCRSVSHQIGGVYAAGVRSRIIGNFLENRFPGSGVGYDAMTKVRERNRVASNSLRNISVTASGLSATLHKDRVHDNHVS